MKEKPSSVSVIFNTTAICDGQYSGFVSIPFHIFFDLRRMMYFSIRARDCLG